MLSNLLRTLVILDHNMQQKHENENVNMGKAIKMKSSRLLRLHSKGGGLVFGLVQAQHYGV
jgi:hypothetical protein